MNKYTIVPSNFKYASAPSVDEEITISLNEKNQELTEYDRSVTLSLAQVYDDERQSCTVFRPTFKVTYIYDNTYTGKTDFLPFQYNLYYTSPETSISSGSWPGFPQYYEFDFYRPYTSDQHFDYKSKSAFTYNWMYYLTYAYRNNFEKSLTYNSTNSSNITWIAKNGIPFTIQNLSSDGNSIISFQCVAPHGLTIGESVELSLSYKNKNLFQVYSLGNGTFDSDPYIFNILNLGYTGSTFNNGTTGTFKRIINPENLETKSKYYVREHKVLTNINDLIMTRAGFEKNVFNEQKKLEFSSITPNKLTRVSQKNSSNSYDVTSAYDLDFSTLVDNQKRPISKIYLSIIFKGYSGYFNQPFNNVGLKQGWRFNISPTSNSWWDGNNVNSNTNIPVASYVRTSGVTKTFYYNQDLKKDDILDGAFCEWNDYEQSERVISDFYHKIKFNQLVFQTTSNGGTNTPGYYYKPHNEMTIRVFSDYIETGDVDFVDQVPSWSFYSTSDQQFRWRDLYSFGFIDSNKNGVDYPYLNMSHYPFSKVIFRLIPEGSNYQITGINEPIKPLIDGCE